MAIDHVLVISGACLDGIKNVTEIVGNECDELEAHGGANILQLTAGLMSAVQHRFVAQVVGNLSDRANEFTQFAIEPIVEFRLQIIDMVLGVLNGAVTCDAARTLCHLLKAGIDWEYAGVAASPFRHRTSRCERR